MKFVDVFLGLTFFYVFLYVALNYEALDTLLDAFVNYWTWYFEAALP